MRRSVIGKDRKSGLDAVVVGSAGMAADQRYIATCRSQKAIRSAVSEAIVTGGSCLAADVRAPEV